MISAKLKDGDEKIEDILRSIRKLIDDRNDPNVKDSDSILELTTEFKEHANNDTIISKKTIEKSSDTIREFTKKLDTCLNERENNLDVIITDLIKPLLKDWLDDNLPSLIEKIITQELRKLISKDRK